MLAMSAVTTGLAVMAKLRATFYRLTTLDYKSGRIRIKFRYLVGFLVLYHMYQRWKVRRKERKAERVLKRLKKSLFCK